MVPCCTKTRWCTIRRSVTESRRLSRFRPLVRAISIPKTSIQRLTYSYCCASGGCRSLRRSRLAGANTPAPLPLPLHPGRWPWPRPGCRSPAPAASPLSHTHTERERGYTSMSVSELSRLTALQFSSALMNPTSHFCFQPAIGSCCLATIDNLFQPQSSSAES